MKQLTIRIICALTFFCLLLGCNRKYDVTSIGGKNLETVRDYDFYDDQIHSWDYLLLTYPSDYVCGNIQKSVASDGLYFISDGKFSVCIYNIAVFSSNGTFRNFIGSRGHSKSEYISIRTWCVDTYRKRVVVVTSSNTIIEYDYEGHYIQTLTPKINLYNVEQIEALPWGGFVMKNSLNDELEDEIVILDTSWTKVSSIKHRDVKIEGGRSSMFSSIIKCDGRVFCMRDICDDIYEITVDGIRTQYFVESGNHSIEWKGQSGNEINKIEYQSGNSFVVDFHSINDCLLISKRDGLVVWNIKTGNGWEYLDETRCQNDEMPAFYFFSGAEGDCLFCVKTTEEIARYANILNDLEMTPSPLYSELLQRCQQDENNEAIILLRYKIKAD